MLKIPLVKIDRFYLFLAATLLLLSVLLIFTLRGVFSAINIASKIDEEVIGPEVRVNMTKLDEAYGLVKNKEIVSLDLE